MIRIRRSLALGALLAGVALISLGAGQASAAPMIFWGDGDRAINALDLVGGGANARTVVSNADGPSGIAVDAAAGRMYWADGDAPGTIRYARLDGTHRRVLRITGAVVDTPVGLTLDPRSGTLYWGNDTGDSIQYARTDGSGGGTLVALTPPADPTSPVVDPVSNRIYWADYSDGTFGSARLDGSDIRKVTPGCRDRDQQGQTVLVDAATDTVYLFTYNTIVNHADLMRMRLDGSGCRTIKRSLMGEAVLGAVVDPDTQRLIWANYSFAPHPDTAWLGLVWINAIRPTAHGMFDLGSTRTGSNAYPALLAAPQATRRATARRSGTAIGATLRCAAPTWSIGNPALGVYRLPQGANRYSWTLHGEPITGATSPRLTTVEAGDYRCVVAASNGAGTSRSTSAAIRVGTPGSVTG